MKNNKELNSKEIKATILENNKEYEKSTNKQTLFNTMPKEFITLQRDYAAKDMEIDKFLLYVAKHIKDSELSVEKKLLMVQALFYNALESPKRLCDYSDDEFDIYENTISDIMFNVEQILEELKKTNKRPLHRDIDCINDDTLASLVQNMSLIQYYYYQKNGNIKKAKEYLIQVIEDSKRNIAWVLSLDASMAPSEYLEESLHFVKDIEFFPGLYPFFEPIIALRFAQPFSQETIWAYEEYTKCLKKIKGSVRNQKELARVFDYFQKELCDSYIEKMADLEEQIDFFRCKISVLIREKDQINKKVRQIQRPGIYPDDYIPTPF